MKPHRIVIWTVALLLSSWVGYRIYCAYADLVTLNVHDMDVHKVIPKIEWQTWEKIVLNKDVNGKVTLHVKRVPLTEVLNIIALQTSARWTALYPIYSRGAATAKLEKVVRGEVPGAANGWSNLDNAPAWKNGGGSMFGNAIRNGNNVVSAQFIAKDLDFAALALSRFAQAQVVPEDGASGMINLKLNQAPFQKAVALVAKQAHRKWEKIFTLQPSKRTVVAMRSPATAPGAPPPTGNKPIVITQAPILDTNMMPVIPQNVPVDQARQTEAFLSTMTPDERQKAEEQINTMQQINSLPPAERQQRMQEMAAQAKQQSQADLDSRMQKRLRDGTIDQRLAHDRSLLNRPPSKGR
jgi:hypothetical protein